MIITWHLSRRIIMIKKKRKKKRSIRLCVIWSFKGEKKKNPSITNGALILTALETNSGFQRATGICPRPIKKKKKKGRNTLKTQEKDGSDWVFQLLERSEPTSCSSGGSQRPSALPRDTVHLQAVPELAPNVPCYQNESASADKLAVRKLAAKGLSANVRRVCVVLICNA